MSLLTRRSLPVIIDSPTPRAQVKCKPYNAKLTLEACAKRAKLATSHRAGNLAGETPLAVSACKACPIGHANMHVMLKHGLSVKTRSRPNPLAFT